MDLSTKNCTDLKINDFVLFANKICLVTEITKSKIKAAFYSEKEKGICFYELKNYHEKCIPFINNALSIISTELKDFYNDSKVTFKKYDYVSYIDQKTGLKKYGSVISGTSKLKVVIDNGQNILTSLKTNFKKEKAPVLEIPYMLKKWSVKGFKEYSDMSEATFCFSATVYENNIKSFVVSNSGKGGCADYSPFISNKDCDRFKDDVVASIIELYPDESHRPSLIEMDENYIQWLSFEYKHHISWKDYLISYI